MKFQPNPAPGVASTCLHRDDKERHLEYASSLGAPFFDEKERNNALDLRKIGAFYALRVVVGSLLESLILLDRYLFLTEHPNVASVKLLPIFHERQSPRNMILIATKEEATISK